MRGLFIGLGLFVLAVVISIAYWYKGQRKPVLVVKGIVGSEKSNFLENPRVKAILKDRYGLTIDYTRQGSIEMVTDSVKPDVDFLWPSSKAAVQGHRPRG